jgi:hypothetical protein
LRASKSRSVWTVIAQDMQAAPVLPEQSVQELEAIICQFAAGTV